MQFRDKQAETVGVMKLIWGGGGGGEILIKSFSDKFYWKRAEKAKRAR